jgi:hypothetical protein
MEHSLDAQHCLTIAAAFIAIIGACASLISLANNKADGLMKRYRELTREHRAQPEGSQRRTDIQEQIVLFDKRTDMVSRAQRLLFITIGLLIICIAIIIVLGLFIIYLNITEETRYFLIRFAIIAIGSFVGFGTACMLLAIIRLHSELEEAKKTFLVETRDCRDSETGNISSADGVAKLGMRNRFRLKILTRSRSEW